MSSSDASRNKKSARQSVELIDGEGAKGELDENKTLAEKKLRFFFSLMFIHKVHRDITTLESF